MPRNGTYLLVLEDGAMLLYFSPYSFTDAAENFRKRNMYDDGWQRISVEEEYELWELNKLDPGEYIRIVGGQIQ